MKSLIGKIHNVSRLRWALLGFLFALGVPATVLVYYSLSELKWETFHQQRALALELTDRINFQINRWVQVEEQRPYSDYQFLVVSGDPAANYFQPSPLSSLDLQESLPGTIGYFQVGVDGEFSSPVLPASYIDAARYGISRQEYARREKLRQRILQILLDNQLLQTQQMPMSPEPLVTRRRASSDIGSGSSTGVSYDLAREQVETRPQAVTEFLTDSTPDDVLDIVPMSARQAQHFDLGLQEEKPDDGHNNSGLNNSGSAEKPAAAFDNLRQLQAVESSAIRDKQLLRDLDIDSKLQEAVVRKQLSEPFSPPAEYSRSARKEQTLIPEPERKKQNQSESESDASDNASFNTATLNTAPASLPRVTMFESEIDPFEFSPLNSGHLVFYRKVLREGALIIQGLVLDRELFLQQAVGREYRETLLSNIADLIVAYRGSSMAIFQGERSYTHRLPEEGISGDLLHQSRLTAPFNDIEVLLSINQLPDGPGARVVRWAAIVMALVLALGTWLLYRLGLRQMRLAQQQQDFVSAVSHELKTPLTSIRMYGEMLREGWADEAKKRQYYDYIYDESERLSRLIANVLQLARVNRNELDVRVKSVSLGELVDNLRSKLHSQIERSGFEFEIDFDTGNANHYVRVDSDALLQIFINLVDNALKFSAKTDTKKITLTVRPEGDSEALFALRDFGPGIDKQHLSKIFDLFYRAENELTRETVGTGIGLALVNQLVRSMQGRLEVHNREQGAEFSIYLKRDD